MKRQLDTELGILKKWHLVLVLLMGIVTPTIAATGAYYGVKQKIAEEKLQMSERVGSLELQANKTYADKESLQRVDDRTRAMQNDITEIKTILKNKLH